MIGIFDSGAGGLITLKELRLLAPFADICFFADREHAPYGTKTQDELTKLVKNDVQILRSAGADEILIACCTASTVFGTLSQRDKEICTPIILPTVKSALRATKNGRIGVIATNATVCSGIFSKYAREISPYAQIKEYAAQPLVSLIESGVKDGACDGSSLGIIERILNAAPFSDIDTLILGCTHFPHIEGIISSFFGNIRIISSAREGAKEIFKKANINGSGRTVFVSYRTGPQESYACG